ncbi:10239_t:CDS:2 [Entrophospora sp. SA101]|nr:13454_t:CDS:2 [Entrophospora sp. SA101]CAJ0847145.1 10239_t:CDS:2 [Entrophospora sp. SA101]
MSKENEQNSELGKKEYWDLLYKRENKNFQEFGDIGEIWFGQDSVEKMVISNSSKSTSILDIGCGNGHLLLELAKNHQYTNLVGIDYSSDAIELAKNIAKDQDFDHIISYYVYDFIENNDDNEIGKSIFYQNYLSNKSTNQQQKFDIILDKGTFDAITLKDPAFYKVYSQNVFNLLNHRHNDNHISVEADINGKVLQRSYTPTSSDDDLGHFDLVIKSYPNGNVSKYFAELEIGQTISVKGPKGQFKYTPGLVRALGMIAAIVKNPNDKTTVNLIFANVTIDDILLKEELDLLAKNHENFNPPNDWNGGRGFITQDMIKKFCPPPANDIKILLCGPPPMISAMSKNCEALGYDKSRTISRLEDQVFKF